MGFVETSERGNGETERETVRAPDGVEVAMRLQKGRRGWRSA